MPELHLADGYMPICGLILENQNPGLFSIVVLE